MSFVKKAIDIMKHCCRISFKNLIYDFLITFSNARC